MPDLPRSGTLLGDDGIARCWWCGDDPLYTDYHDQEWGRPVADDQRLFEKICLEGFMAGLSWLTILRKRETFRDAFHAFDLETVARFDETRIEELMRNSGIVRNRAKIEATINNARRCLMLIEEEGTLASYLWSREPDRTNRPETIDWATLLELGVSPEAAAVSKDLKRRGWKFVGPTTIYSVMESVGLVNDHMTACDYRNVVEEERRSFISPG